MRCLICGRWKALERTNVNELEDAFRVAVQKAVGINWGDHAVVVICKVCRAEYTLAGEFPKRKVCGTCQKDYETFGSCEDCGIGLCTGCYTFNIRPRMCVVCINERYADKR